MNFPIFLTLLSGITSLVTAVYAWRRRSMPGAVPFAGMMLSVAIWSLASVAEFASPGLEMKVFWSKVAYFGVVSVAPLFFVFSLEYSHRTRWLSRGFLLGLLGFSLAILVLAWTNEWHGLVWSQFVPVISATGKSWIYVHGLVYYLLIVYSYVLMAIGTVNLLQTALNSHSLYRWQVVVVMVAALLPWFGNLVYVLGISPWPEIDPGLLSFTLSGVLLVIGLNRLQILRLHPLARDVLVTSLRDGMVVLDEGMHVVDINPAAGRMLGVEVKKGLGKPLTELTSGWSEMIPGLPSNEDYTQEIMLREDMWVEMHISPIYGEKQRTRGRLVLLHDISERKQNEKLQHAIYLISEAASNVKELDDLYRQVHGIIRRLLPAKNCFIALYDPASEMIRFPYFVDEHDEEPGPTRLGVGLTSYVIKHGQPLLATRETAGELKARGEILSMGTPSAEWLGAPLKTTDQQVFGALVIQSYDPEIHYTPGDKKILVYVSTQVAAAIQRQQMLMDLRQKAIRDELTGVYNRRGLMELGKREIDRSLRYGRPISLLILEVDRFRELNDGYGFEVGDEALRLLAQELNKNLREIDLVGRYGEDEFVVLLPETNEQGSVSTANRLYASMEKLRLQVGDEVVQFSFSIGVGLRKPEEVDLGELIWRAGRALHSARRSGNSGVIRL
jgi:diguanylate cyclase (GGDEF)-like protein/PAS domain S-box-containing protein